MAFKEVFKRVEKKYIITEEQYKGLAPSVDEYMCGDSYGESTIFNIYYDTPSFALVRASNDKPVYKEKLRLRCYGTPTDTSIAFVEIKKKYRGIVYKRRISMPYKEAMEFTTTGVVPESRKDSQIAKEISWLLSFYDRIAPAMVLSYDRTAYFGKDDPNLRITFDKNLLFRDYDFDLTKGAYGTPLLPDGMRLMEVKIPDAMPIWLARKFSELSIFPTSFSKYGTAYIDVTRKVGETEETEEKESEEKQNV